MRGTSPFRLRATRIAPAHEPVALPALPAWMGDERRACNPAYGKDHLFVSDSKKDRGQAVKLCRERCPLLVECQARAVQRAEEHYVWGGKDFSKKSVQAEAQRQRDNIPAPEPVAAPVRNRKDRAGLDAQVRELYALDLPDQLIAIRLGRSTSTISYARRRQNLPSKFGPGGVRVKAPVSA